jgi:outer membrane lipoprotein-sorting protein
MKFLRTVSTRRLLAMIAGLVVVIAGGTAIAVAATGNGPVPKREPLAKAIRLGLAAPEVNGISARISFTNHLIASSAIQGSDPILTGASGRLWWTKDKLRLELQSDNGDAQVLVNGNRFWISDPNANTVYEGTLPGGTSKGADTGKADHGGLPSVAKIQSELNRLAQHVNLSGAIPGDVAGRPTYTVKVQPQHDGGKLGAVELAWDALKGIPLRFAIYANGDSSPVIELKATDISYGPVSSSVFAITPPSGAKVVTVAPPAGHAKTRADQKGHREIRGAAAVAKHLPFKLLAPPTLVGLPRRSVTLLDWGGKPAALVTYGENLGGMAVIQQQADNQAARPSSGDHGGLNLPTVSIDGTSAQELNTALGTVLMMNRGGVKVTVIGSVKAVAAEAAARQLWKMP